MYALDVRGIAFAGLVTVACTATNPAFDTTGVDATGTSSPMSSTSTSTTGVSATGTTSTTTSGNVEESETRSPESDDAESTGEPRPPEPRICCNAEECEPEVRTCVCELNPSCCDGRWAGECVELAIACNGVCDGNLRPCCVPHGEPSCTGVLLAGFCIGHQSCCGIAWTAQCVVDYDAYSGHCDLEPCETAHESPGCNDADAMDCVCVELDKPQCCTEAWTAECVDAMLDC